MTNAVTAALVIGAEMADASHWMPLYLVLAPGHVLDDDLRDRIRAALLRPPSFNELSPNAC